MNEYQRQKRELEPEKKPKDSPAEEQIPVPPTDEIHAPIKEPVIGELPTNPIIDEDSNRTKMIVS